jgi:hypothetical protein
MSTYYWQTPLSSWPTDTVERLAHRLNEQLRIARRDVFSPDENLASESERRIPDLKARAKPYWEELHYRSISERGNRNRGVA